MRFSRFNRIAFIFFLSAACGLLACSSLTTPPRLTKTRVPENQASEPSFYAAPTPTGNALELPDQSIDENEQLLNPILTVWINETSNAHQKMLEEMTIELDRDYGLHMEFVLVDESRMADLVKDAAEVNKLPDVIIHSLAYSTGWAERGVFDTRLTNDVLESLGRDSFDPVAIDLIDVDGNPAALPVTGYKQVLIYRQDWFDTLSLAPPTDYRSILQGARAIYRSDTLSAQTGISSTLLSGLVVPTESDLVTTHQVFEHFAIANNCDLVADTGQVTVLTPECFDTFEFYRELVNGFSPSDIQTDISAINAYLSGRTGMILGSPDLLLQIAGLSTERQPACPECLEDPTFLITNSGVNTQIAGRSSFRDPAEFGQMSLIGFTTGTQPELAERFANYWYNDGYMRWIGVEPIMRVPMRPGTLDDPTKFLVAWDTLPVDGEGSTVSDILGAETTQRLVEGVAVSPRWGIQSRQGDLIATVYEDNILSIVLQEMLSGYFTSSQAIVAASERVVEQIPGYAFETDVPVFIPSNDSE
ncbi:MAG: hypothetical protein AAGD96_08230 [Chloroflexota bacterium]